MPNKLKPIIHFLTVICLAFPIVVQACWTPVSLEEFVKGKHLIVVGEIQRVVRAPKARRGQDTGYIQVERVLRCSLRKTPKVGSEILLSMPSANNEVRVSTDIHYIKGQRGIWILYYEDGKFRAGHPMSLQPLTEEENVVAALKGKQGK